MVIVVIVVILGLYMGGHSITSAFCHVGELSGCCAVHGVIVGGYRGYRECREYREYRGYRGYSVCE